MSPTPTITDLARALNLSISSVSYALNGQKGVSEATLELGGVAVSLDNPACVAKSFPDFWTAWALIRRANEVPHAL